MEQARATVHALSRSILQKLHNAHAHILWALRLQQIWTSKIPTVLKEHTTARLQFHWKEMDIDKDCVTMCDLSQVPTHFKLSGRHLGSPGKGQHRPCKASNPTPETSKEPTLCPPSQQHQGLPLSARRQPQSGTNHTNQKNENSIQNMKQYQKMHGTNPGPCADTNPVLLNTTRQCLESWHHIDQAEHHRGTGASLQDDQGLRAQLSKVTAGSLALEEFDVQISKCATKP